MSSKLLAIMLVACAAVPCLAAKQSWDPAGKPAEAFIGAITFTPTRITFENGKSLALIPSGTKRFTNDLKQTVSATVYRVATPQVIDTGARSKICDGKPITAFLLVTTKDIGGYLHRLDVFSGPSLVNGSPDDCGTFAFFSTSP